MTDCAAVREVAAELALGTLAGPARGEALAHLAGCPECRAEVQSLAEAADQLLALASEAEPPAGFESAVLARIQPPATPSVRRRVLLAAAAVVLVLAGLGAGLLVGSGGGDSGELASAAMVDPDGETVGEVWRSGGDEATLVVSVPAWADIESRDGPRYAFRLELDGGGTVEVGDFGLGDGSSSWGVDAPVAAESITAVSVIDDTGRVWCTGTFA